jgi:hypothetical protein
MDEHSQETNIYNKCNIARRYLGLSLVMAEDILGFPQ